MLWLHGPPASGKSVLSSFIIDYLSSLDISCSFFFFRFGDQTKRSPNALLRSLAYQLAAQLPGLNRKLQDLHDDGLRLEKKDARTIWNKVYVEGLFKMELRDPLYWVIDALDESEAPHTLLEILSSVSKAAIPIHLLLISRWTEHLSSSFDRTEQWPNIQTHSIEAQESDIHTFVRKELHYLRGDAAFKQRVLEGIRQRASGNFLWVSLAMKEIRKCHTEKAIEAALSEIPSGMGYVHHCDSPALDRTEYRLVRMHFIRCRDGLTFCMLGHKSMLGLICEQTLLTPYHKQAPVQADGDEHSSRFERRRQGFGQTHPDLGYLLAARNDSRRAFPSTRTRYGRDIGSPPRDWRGLWPVRRG